MAEGKIAILGGAGMLGSDLVLACELHGYKAQVFDLPEFDISDSQQLKKVISSVDSVVNCAAYTNVDGAESERDLAFAVNADAVGQLGNIARDGGKWVLHISTDFVFDGKSDRPYVETDAPNPINAYGASKLAGEQLLVESGCRYCIMRIEWTYGLGGNNFITKLISLAKQGKKLRVVDDQIGSPTATGEAAKVICKLLQKKPQGLLHFASAGYVSRFETARFIFDKLGMDVDLQPCKSSDYKTPAERPLNSCFDCSKIKPLLDEPIKPWQELLERFLLSSSQ